MKAYLTSIGEPTTEIAAAQLERFGFDVEILAGAEPWAQKYQRFIEMASDDCIRMDADVIVNENIKLFGANCRTFQTLLMAQAKCYDFYRNGIGVTSPVFYSKRALQIIAGNYNKLDWTRPEATAWRIPSINPYTVTYDLVVGMHGFFQDAGHLSRHLENKIERKQISEYDFDLAQKLLALRPS